MPRRIPPSLCARCKGYKKLCGLPTCPILERFRAQARIAPRISGSTVEGSTPPSVIVGEAGYPRVPLLYNIPPGVHGPEARRYDDPRGWSSSRLSLREIIGYRSSMVASLSRAEAHRPEKLYERELSLAAVSEKPVDTEAVLEKPPVPSLRLDGILAPQGPTAPAKMIQVAGNPKPPRQLEKRIWDDARSSEVIVELYRGGLDVYTITPALSLGLLGRARSRRLVPTRWAITAVDQTISDWLIHRVRAYDTIDEYEVYHAGYLGNYFTVILVPGSYEAELIEVWHPLTPWVPQASRPVVYVIREYPSMRTNIMDGGYIAVRLAVAEHLYARRRQAKALIVREITREYYAPVGNWHIRETMRRALSSRPVAKTSTLEEALAAALQLLRSREAREALRRSPLLGKIRATRTLDLYLNRSPGAGERES